MNQLRRAITTSLSLGLISIPHWAQAAGDHGAEGVFSTMKPPVPNANAETIEIVEFFWYGCPHCFKVDPMVNVWEKKLSADVSFRREHIVWDSRKETSIHAQIFATLRAMDSLSKYHLAVFEAIHKDRINFREDGAIINWAIKNGIDSKAFESMYKSFGMQAQVNKMRTLTNTYKIDGVPKFIVNGQFSTEPHQAGGEVQVFEVLNQLIAQQRIATKRN
ncbi:thiol:disulfide interchange protein DsbA/DsbL [Sphaerotilus sp.]|uniref:thiol:disulfide interchange protein DsbA/DsbL n=1 Tax=Sphaerotilus sp. TaxID=2093942 RepID=UPI002ACECFAA|nr:thiol:disulfide interchange protein DsbA/DsbL [Sphaerotilus sp.]MDZ7854796.1 thiol:disulfide interchange protein DsbA/DsbL [Sphaerotilus sp.]